MKQEDSFGQVTIQVPARISVEFKKAAKASFPNETFAYLLGHKADGKICIDELFFPTDVEKFCGPDYVDVQNNWTTEVKKKCKRDGLTILGDLHAHPYNNKQLKKYNTDTSPSEQDWNSLKEGHIMGICLITECKNGNLKTRIRFWGPFLKVCVKEIK